MSQPRIVRLPFQFVPYGESYFSTQFHVASKEDSAPTSEETEKNTKSSSQSQPVLTPSSSPYELLNLNHLRYRATQSQIKRQYKKQAIKYHPDRFGSDAMFKKIQQAYELLSNERKRRKYDSKDSDFDNFLESEEWEEPVREKNWETFKERFGEYFDLWSKWSDKGVPQFGNSEANIDRVMQFYEFFEEKFSTWRDYACFDDDDDFDPNDADNAEERRYYEKKNKKKHQKKRQSEMKKLRQLVRIARKHDPRVVEHKEKIRREQEAQQEKKRKQEEERRRKEYERKQEEERRKKEEEERKRQEEEKRRREKDEHDKKFNHFADKIRDAARPYTKIGLNPNEIKKLERKKENFVRGEDIELLCMNLNLEQIETVATKIHDLRSKPDSMTKALRKVVKQYREAEEKKKRDAEEKLQNAKKKRQEQKQDVEWTKSELAALVKATKTYPSGTRNRWECLANHIGTRTAEEVQRKVGELRKSSNPLKDLPKREDAQSKKDDDPAQWSVAQQKQLEAGLRKHRALKGDAKWTQIASGVDGKTPEACKARFQYCKELAKQKKKAK